MAELVCLLSLRAIWNIMLVVVVVAVITLHQSIQARAVLEVVALELKATEQHQLTDQTEHLTQEVVQVAAAAMAA
jgi:hypothetical protein